MLATAPAMYARSARYCGVEVDVSSPSWNGTPYSCSTSARRSTSPAEAPKKATRPPFSTIDRLSPTATCILLWNAIAGARRYLQWLRERAVQFRSSNSSTLLSQRRQFIRPEVVGLGRNGMDFLRIFQPFPEPLRGTADLFRLVPYENRLPASGRARRSCEAASPAT